MARTKKKVVETIKAPEVRKVEPKIEPKIQPQVKLEAKPEIRTVLGSNKAEALQKEGGWLLISAVKVDVDVGGLTVKEYKFRKE